MTSDDKEGEQMKKVSYEYQIPLINEVHERFKTEDRVVLAATPGAGKTNMAIQIANQIVIANPQAKVVVLTHGQVLIREQWVDRMKTVKAKNLKDKMSILKWYMFG